MSVAGGRDDLSHLGPDDVPSALTIPRRLIPTAMMLHQHGRGTETDLGSLRAHGWVTRHALSPVASAILDVLVRPTVIVRVRTVRDSEIHRSTLWANLESGAVGQERWPAEFEFHLAEPLLLPFHAAAVLGVDASRPRTEPADGERSRAAPIRHHVDTTIAGDDCESRELRLADDGRGRWWVASSPEPPYGFTPRSIEQVLDALSFAVPSVGG